MNFSPESQNYIDHMRNLIHQRSMGLSSSTDPYTNNHPLAKLIRASNGGGPFSNGGSMTSVIQSPQSHHQLINSTFDDRRHSIPDSVGSTGSGSNISPASSAEHEHDDMPDSPSSKVPLDANIHLLSPVAEEHDDGIPPDTPKSGMSDEYHGSATSEHDYESRNAVNGNFNNLLHQQLLHRKGSILQYCLTNPSGQIGLHGGSDAEADHASTSPGSSDLQDDVTSGSGCYKCAVCDFSSISKFHFNSHMNTHCVHRCPIPECNYSTRTEGRLRRHVKNHHNSEDSMEGDGMEDSSIAGVADGISGAPGSGSGSSSKVKNYKCKQCHDYVASSKNDYYDHQRLHIKPEKLLICPLEGCRFVTEYKHHLEYHVRNHSGSKPFKCPNSNCNYQCVNKSMLNSHMKSHSNFYQFRCECGYATKYCHSLKQHLKKYQHKATNNGPESAQLSMAASPQPLQIIQAPSPKSEDKPPKRRRNTNKIPVPPQMPMNTFAGYHSNPNDNPMANAFPYGLYAANGHLSQFQQAASIYNNLLLSAAAANGLMHPAMASANGYGRHGVESPDSGVKRESMSPNEIDRQPEVAQGNTLQEMLGRRHNGVLRMLPQSRTASARSAPSDLTPTNNTSPLDLSGGKENGNDRHSESPKSDTSSATGNANNELSSSRRRRKGPAFKLDLAVRQRLQEPEVEEQTFSVQPESPESLKTLSTGSRFCDFCGLGFEDPSMYTMHMGFHSREDPYTCGLCGHVAADKVTFFLHIAKAPHY